MNTRIKELLRQAGTDCSGKWLSLHHAEEFAELIVRECAQLARDTDLEDVEGGDSQVLRAVKLQILEHFGVKE